MTYHGLFTLSATLAPGALAALLRSLEASPVRLSVLSSRAVWTDGRDHPMNTQRSRLGASAAEKRDAARAGGRPIRTASYVSHAPQSS